MTASAQSVLSGVIVDDFESLSQRRRLLSHSQIAEWLRCRYRWDKKYQQKIRPRKTARPLTLGQAVHLGMSHYFLTKEQQFSVEDQLLIWESQNNTGLGEEEMLEFHDIVVLAGKLARRALQFMKAEQWEVVAYKGEPLCEKQIIVPLEGWDGYVGVFDLVARDLSTGYVWLIDNKVIKTIAPDDVEEVNVQMAGYQYILKSIGISDVKGSIRYQIKSTLPAQPKTNKDGTFSRAACATDWETYRSAVIEAGQNPVDYVDMQEKLRDAEFFRMTHAYRSDFEVEAIWDQVILKAAAEIRSLDHHVYRSLGTLACFSCDFRSLCLAELRNEDVPFIMQTQYLTRDQEMPALPADRPTVELLDI